MPVVRVSPGPAQNGTPSRRTACRKHEPMESFTESDPECYNGCNVHQRNGWLVSPTPRRQEEDTLCCNSSTTHDKLHVSGKKRDYRNSTARGLKTSSERMVIGSNRKNSLLKSSDAFQGCRKRGISGLLDITCHTLTPYQKLVRSLSNDESWHRDVTLERRIGFYRFKGDAGTGNFSRVKIGIHCLTKEKVAIKILEKAKLDAKTQRMLSREISSMERLHHPNVVRLFEVIETFSKVYLVVEYAAAGELYQRITSQGRLSEETAKPLFAQIVSAIDHMHQHHIIHRDIKAENVFFADTETVKVGDFGFATHVKTRDELLNTFCGSPPYAAPELFSDESYDGPSVDIWALGVLLYFMVTATMPFRAQTVACLKQLILNGEYLMPDFVSNDCSRVIRGLLQHEPSKRLAITDMRECKWLQGMNFVTSLPKYKVTDISCQMLDEESCTKQTSLSPEEQEVRRQLQHLGIDEDLLFASQKDGVRSSVIGTYRILLHRLVTLNRQFGSRVILESLHHEAHKEQVQEVTEIQGKGEGSEDKEKNVSVKTRVSRKSSVRAEKRIFVDSEGFFIPEATNLFTETQTQKCKRSVVTKMEQSAADSNGNTFPALNKGRKKKSWKSKNIVKSCILF